MSVAFGAANTGGNVRACFSVLMDCTSLVVRGSNVEGWSLQRFLFNGATSRAKFGKKGRNKLHKPKNDRNSLRLVN